MTRFVPTEEMLRLTRGSYESLISSLDEAVQAQAESLFGSKVETHVLGTFPGYALVAAADDGRCLRVKYEQASGGGIHIVQTESIDVPSYDEENLDEFLQTESEKVLDLFRKGSVEEAEDRLRSLVTFTGKWTGPKADLTESWFEALHRGRPWLRLYEARKDRIHRALWDNLKALEDSRLRPKFQRLYDGSSIKEDLAGYRDLVVDEFGTLNTRINELKQKIQGAYAAIRVTTPRMEEAGEGDMMTTFTAFAEDLLEDLSRINTIATEAPEQVNRLDLLGRLYDQTVERFYKMEVAGGFISQMATRLSEAQ